MQSKNKELYANVVIRTTARNIALKPSHKAWWEREEFEWVQELESNFDIIKEELETLRSEKGF